MFPSYVILSFGKWVLQSVKFVLQMLHFWTWDKKARVMSVQFTWRKLFFASNFSRISTLHNKNYTKITSSRRIFGLATAWLRQTTRSFTNIIQKSDVNRYQQRISCLPTAKDTPSSEKKVHLISHQVPLLSQICQYMLVSTGPSSFVVPKWPLIQTFSKSKIGTSLFEPSTSFPDYMHRSFHDKIPHLENGADTAQNTVFVWKIWNPLSNNISKICNLRKLWIGN